MISLLIVISIKKQFTAKQKIQEKDKEKEIKKDMEWNQNVIMNKMDFESWNKFYE